MQVGNLDIGNTKVYLSPGSVGSGRNILGMPHSYPFEKRSSTMLWPWFKILMLKVFLYRVSSNFYLWCITKVLSIGPIIIPWTIVSLYINLSHFQCRPWHFTWFWGYAIMCSIKVMILMAFSNLFHETIQIFNFCVKKLWKNHCNNEIIAAQNWC